jgi:excisionase family DNA binding protein
MTRTRPRRLTDVLTGSEEGWREVHAALVPHNKRGDSTAGRLFEEFAKHFFVEAPEYRGEFKNVWAENEIPGRVKKRLTLATRDHGVDLLLEDHDGRFYAVQCKFKTDQSKTLGWTKDRLSSWLAESDEAQGLIMFTNASAIDRQSTQKATKKDFTLVTVSDLLALSPETVGNICRLAQGRRPKKPKPLEPRRHQKEAIRSVLNGFKAYDRGQLILPCGAGKTLTSLWLKERLGAKRTLVLVPSLALLRQIRREWATQQRSRIPYLCVCSEKDIDKDKRDAIVAHTFEVPGRVTTKPDEILAFAQRHSGLVVYSTYQSLRAVLEAGVEFDLAICDEAHKTATARHNEFALVHDEGLRVDKRLFMTATPRVLSPQMKGRLGEAAFEVVADMGDEETFGPEFHRMGFGDAIEQAILVDYKIVVVGVSDQEVAAHIARRTYLDDAPADQVATSLALEKVMREHRLGHGLTFHSNVKRAKLFKQLHGQRAEQMQVEHVNGSMSTNDRLVLLDEFKDAPRAVMTNARCLTEGVDVPAIDCVAFVDPKHSKVDIVQAAGRALRLGNKDKGYGVILIPVFYNLGEDAEAVAARGVFRNVFEVVRAMADQDERLNAEITGIRLGEGEREGTSGRLRIEFDDEERLVLQGFEQKLKEALVERIVERAGDDWELRFAELQAYKVERGHCDVAAQDGSLGKWVARQRSAQRAGVLSATRSERLSTLGLKWEIRKRTGVSWEERRRQLQTYIREHGDASPSSSTALGRWVVGQRGARKRGILSGEKAEGLDAIGFDWKEDAVGGLTLLEVAQAIGRSGGWMEQYLQAGGAVRPIGTRGRKHVFSDDAPGRIMREKGVTLRSVEGLLTVHGIAKAVGYDVGAIRKLVASGELKPLGTGWAHKGVDSFFSEEAIARARSLLNLDQNMDEVFTCEEFGNIFGVNPKVPQRWVRRGAIEGVRVGRRVLIPRSQVEVAKEAMGYTHTAGELREEGLVSLREFAALKGLTVSAMNQRVLKGLIEPRGRAPSGGAPGWYFHPDQEAVPTGGSRGERNPAAKLTKRQAQEIYADKSRTNAEIAKAYGVSIGTVSHIKSGKSWSRATGHKANAKG